MTYAQRTAALNAVVVAHRCPFARVDFEGCVEGMIEGPGWLRQSCASLIVVNAPSFWGRGSKERASDALQAAAWTWGQA